MPENDSVMRAMTDDGAFRIVAARTTDTTQGVIAAQKLSGAIAHDMADLVTSAVLYRETMAPTLRVQCIVRFDEEAGQLIADSHPDGWTRGLLQQGSGSAPPNIRRTRATLEMMRTLPNSDLHRGVVEVPESGNLSEAFMRYMQLSEQIISMISLGSVAEGENPTAGGFVVQLLPEATEAEAAMATMTKRLEDFVEIRERLQQSDGSPSQLIEQIFEGMPFTWLDSNDIRFGCQCSELRVMTTLSLLDRSEIQELVDEGEPLSIGCDYCGTSYAIEIAQLQGLLSAS
ncbi:MAG: Hsp33 family molecular chaperone HslO [Deltaproteobacteria bacterium]|jgi:molecular chaperone Hsp33|nr:Hsp33 family molecular chaperone HslO [Deltaproteobacteria bacterium]MBW1873817.1 Hsp33 family molecular chaperone HslO [Deltaproteobacteria bacterium]MBW2209968.1 Hsp33 family molecular chaperone HslO [Deltaproteobacteria bacterium]MBW2213713.1 Hsp33 family molecular chaperone HslO [Deltaproteobacteria bacterium]MBW2379190.1 Hsp33 family molecular chaperone HslO [Deltaproteobacteria bacterium]